MYLCMYEYYIYLYNVRKSAQPLGCTRHAARGSLDVAMLSGMGGYDNEWKQVKNL